MLVKIGFLTALLLLSATASSFAQDKPVFTDYRGVTIGMSAADARAKLGKAKDQSDTEDYFEFANDESARLLYDGAKKVRAISITYDAKDAATPTPMAIFGKDAERRADGGIMKRVEYPKSGVWISYVRTGGNEPIVIVTVQKMLE
ncbi:hypothetical protein [Leptolyngbya sp. 7M]|uniref:hypothetical protein n=1 Tax=Leptolyngbya sp. 7M TaxID=2812896 RepID=UPI001B8D8D64|nr:hypothetical protein [Leptolyngbya sp. 7M]QYO67481.1 hypothetical protein JVX88_12205 [Leptolyngbya sp. 7M]